MKTVGNTVLAQNIGLDIPLQESDHNFGIVYQQVSLSKVASLKTKIVIFSINGRCFVIKECHCSSRLYRYVRVAFSKKLSKMQIKRAVDQLEKNHTINDMLKSGRARV